MERHLLALARLSCTTIALACNGATAPAVDTGFEGVVRRGPVTPVCRVDVPCDAPFSASFDVRTGKRVVARFTSDAAGKYLVMLAPGDYTVVPDTSAPLLGASQQTRAVTVGRSGVTHIDMDFDTGIR